VEPGSLQWGRALSSAEIRQEPTRIGNHAEQLQWGRALSSAEMMTSRCAWRRLLRFNGAAPFRARK